MKRKSVRTKERYILDSLVSVFKGGHWVDEVPIESVAAGPENGSGGRTEAYLTVIGGQKYDPEALLGFLEEVNNFPVGTTLVVGDGRGVEQNARAIAEAWEYRIVMVEVNPEFYGKAARKVNVEQVLSFAPNSPLLLVGNGERVKQAKQWLKRARWPREVVEIL